MRIGDRILPVLPRAIPLGQTLIVPAGSGLAQHWGGPIADQDRTFDDEIPF